MFNSEWAVDSKNPPQPESIIVGDDFVDSIVIEEMFNMSDIVERLDKLETSMRIMSRPHISRICKEILLYFDTGTVDRSDEYCRKFSNLPLNKAKEVEALAHSCNIPYYEFCAKANELIDICNEFTHPSSRNIETLQARVAEAQVLLQISDVEDFERFLISNFCEIEKQVLSRTKENTICNIK